MQNKKTSFMDCFINKQKNRITRIIETCSFHNKSIPRGICITTKPGDHNEISLDFEVSSLTYKTLQVPVNEEYVPRHVAEDAHSQLSEDGDSGRGGSVSDGHMGVSQDADDLRIMQLQNIVRQSGRRGTPPHLQSRNHDDKNIPKSSNLTPRDKNTNQCVNNVQKCNDDRMNSNYSKSNTDIYYNDNDKRSNIHRYPSYHENTYGGKSVTFSNTPQKQKSGPGIQMGLSSISSQHHPSSSRHRPHRQHSFDTFDNYRQAPPPNYQQHNPNKMYPPRNNRMLDETMDSIATTVYDDDDNTTTSGSYTIDNNANDDFMELNVAQLKDIFV